MMITHLLTFLPLQYYYPGIYDSEGFTSEFVIKEAVFTTMTEWCTCASLLSTSLLSATKKEKKLQQTKDDDDQEEQAEKFDGEVK